MHLKSASMQAQEKLLAATRQFKAPQPMDFILLLLISLLPVVVQAAPIYHNISAGNIKSDNLPIGYVNANVSLTMTLSINDFFFGTTASNRADYYVRQGVSQADDSANGVLMGSVMENARQNYGSNMFMQPIIEVAGGGYRLCPAGAVNSTATFEDNINVAGAFFFYTNWLGGYARNAAGANAGSNNAFTGSPGLVLGTHFRPLYDTNNITATMGKSVVDFTSLGIDSRSNGVLLVIHAKDESNFALSQVNSNNGTWNVFVKGLEDGSAGANDYEQDPVAFVYIPRTNNMVISGRVDADNSSNDPTTPIYSGVSPRFTCTRIATGRWTLKIPGRYPTNGVLIVSPEGGGTFNADNIVTYQPNTAGDGWEVQSRDLAAAGLQNPRASDGSREPCFSFVYIPKYVPGITVTTTNSLQTTEAGGTARFTVVLDAPPSNNVAITVSSSDTTEGQVDVTSLTFTPENWYVAQAVTITGQNDFICNGNEAYTIVLGAASSVDADYNGMNPADVSVQNLEPVVSANAASYTRSGTTLKIYLTNLLVNASESFGQPLTLAGVGSDGSNLTTTNGISLTTNATFIGYTSTTNVTDAFYYTVVNPLGCTASALVVINSTPTGVAAQSISASGSSITVSFSGIPGYQYVVERADDTGFSINLTNLSTNTAPGNGQFSVTDDSPPTPTAFYRLKYSP